MKLARLIDEQFQETLKKLVAQQMPLRTAYKLRTIIKKIDEELVNYESVRKAALDKYGTKKEDGTLDVSNTGQVSFSPEAIREFAKELNDLANMDIELGSVTIDDLGDKVQLTTEELMHLDALIS